MQTRAQREADIKSGVLTYHITTWMRLGDPKFAWRPLGLTGGDMMVVHVEVCKEGVRVGGFDFEQTTPEVDEKMIHNLVAMGRYEPQTVALAVNEV